MALSIGGLVFDELSLALSGLGFVVFLYYQWNVYSPDIHGSFLTCQANTSPTRLLKETVVYRHRSTPFSSELTARLHREINTVNKLLRRSLEENDDRDIIGFLPQTNNPNSVAWQRGKDVFNKVLKFGNGLSNLLFPTQADATKEVVSPVNSFNLKPDLNLGIRKLNVIALASHTSLDLITAFMAGALFNFTIDLISPKFLQSSENLSILFNQLQASLKSGDNAGSSVFLTTKGYLQLVLTSLELVGWQSNGDLPLIVVLDSTPEELSALNTKLNLLCFSDIGTGIGGQLTHPSHPAESESVLFRIWWLNKNREFGSYEFLDRHVMSSVSAIGNSFPIQLKLDKEDVYLSPRSIISTSEWSTVLYMLFKGCQVGLPSYGVASSKQYALFQPTVTFLSGPDLLDLIQRWGLGVGNEPIGEELVSTHTPSPPPWGVIKRWYLHSKLKVLKQHRCLEAKGVLDARIFAEERQLFGGKLRLCYLANPYIPLAHRNALRVILNAQIISTFSLSPYDEGAVANFGWLFCSTFFDYNPDPSLPLVGAPAPSVEVKLKLDYEPTNQTTEDPTGKLIVRGNSIVSKNEDGEGWVFSGRMATASKTCSLAVLGDVNDQLTLSPSWTGLWWIETWIMAHDPYIHHIRLYVLPSLDDKPSPLRLGGWISLRLDPVLKFARNRDLPMDLEQLGQSQRLHAQVLQGVQGELANATAADSTNEPREGITLGLPGPLPPIELESSKFTITINSNDSSSLAALIPELGYNPEFWE